MTLNPLQKVLLFAGVGILIAGGAVIAMEPKLAKIHKNIEADYERVAHIDGEAFSNLVPENTVIFDVREPEEFAVSHLPGAIQVDPGISEADFQARYSSLLEDKIAVFYCSVGRRSSNLAERVADTVEAETNAEPVNLIGGLFQWSNDNRTLTTTQGAPTTAIHPYNTHWGRLIDDRSAIQYTPSTPIPEQE